MPSGRVRHQRTILSHSLPNPVRLSLRIHSDDYTEPNYLFDFAGMPRLRSASSGTECDTTSMMNDAGVIPAKSPPSKEIDCNPISIALGSPAVTAAPGGNKGSK